MLQPTRPRMYRRVEARRFFRCGPFVGSNIAGGSADSDIAK
jgi:hypothetical protein